MCSNLKQWPDSCSVRRVLREMHRPHTKYQRGLGAPREPPGPGRAPTAGLTHEPTLAPSRLWVTPLSRDTVPRMGMRQATSAPQALPAGETERQTGNDKAVTLGDGEQQGDGGRTGFQRGAPGAPGERWILAYVRHSLCGLRRSNCKGTKRVAEKQLRKQW